MHFSSAQSRNPVARLLLLSLLFCASCNLNANPDSAAPDFAGPPIVVITAPQPEQQYLAGATAIVQARIENAGPDLARVAVLLDEALLGERWQPNDTGAQVLPLTIDWPTSATGSFTIAVVAERADGTVTREERRITVVAPGSDAATQPASQAPEPATEPPSSDDSAPAQDGVNLMVTGIELFPAEPACGAATMVRASVLNDGSLASQTSAWVIAKAHLVSDGSVSAETAETSYLPKLQAGEATTLELSLTIAAHPSQPQQIRVTVDAGNHILESNEDDNIGSSREFTLSQGSCA